MPGPGKPIDVTCLATPDTSCTFAPRAFQRRPVGDHDVLIDMKYCGICHTDLHAAAGHLKAIGSYSYPCVPGHELAGVVEAVGAKVTKFKVGDAIGVGCMVDSCMSCAACKRGDEQLCSRQTGTYNAVPKNGRADTVPAGSATLGGYTTKHVVHEAFGVRIPAGYPLECAGPVMCAGVTLYSPLVRYGARAGTKVAIVGLGGLGVMGVKIAAALGCDVAAVSRSGAKRALAAAAGATRFVDSSSALDLQGARGAFDLVLNTIPGEHDYTVYTALAAPSGKHVVLGLNSVLAASFVTGAIACGTRVKGSGIGSIAETQAVVDLCAKAGIRPELKVIPVEGVNAAYEALDRANDAGVRYVIDLGTLDAGAGARCAAAPPPALGPAKPLSVGAILSTLGGMVFLGHAW